jgi:mono/diheme cytochrome c family protein
MARLVHGHDRAGHVPGEQVAVAARDADAGSIGTVASDLDEKKPTGARAQDVVTNGTGAMPANRKPLTHQEISDVAAYVAWAAGR